MHTVNTEPDSDTDDDEQKTDEPILRLEVEMRGYV